MQARVVAHQTDEAGRPALPATLAGTHAERFPHDDASIGEVAGRLGADVEREVKALMEREFPGARPHDVVVTVNVAIEARP